MQIYTIGFTQKSAEQFFGLLAGAGVQCLVDIRLHPHGQLAGFTKKEDLPFFLKRLNNCAYTHLERLAPSLEVMQAYHRDHDWQKFSAAYLSLLEQRDIPGSLERELFERQACCLLCSEASPQHCHRRLAAERLARHWGAEIVHL